jgi:hypothetical protein
MGTPFSFREEKNQVFYHDVKIFIYGTDVTPWLTSQVTLQKADRDGTNTLSFSLANQYRAFEITRENLGEVDLSLPTPTTAGKPKFRLTDPYTPQGQYSELAKAKIFSLKTQVERNTKIMVKTKGPVISPNQTGRIKKITDENTDTSNDDVTTRYPMSVGSLVFHKYDPIRFFVKNPLSRSDDEWTCEFTGYLDSKPYTQNYTTGESVINITCQDIRVLMALMRVQANPTAQVSNENMLYVTGGKNKGIAGSAATDSIDAGFFNDFVIFKDVSHVLAGMRWDKSIETLIYGIQGKGGAYRGGIGKFKKGMTISFDPSKQTKFKALEDWNNVVNFGVRPLPVVADVAPLIPQDSLEADPKVFNEFPKSASDGKMEPGGFLTKAEVYALGTSTVPDKAGSPDACKVHFLLPAEGTPNQNMIEYNVIERLDLRVELVTRLELLSQLCKSLDYQMYVNGMGDVIFEFPMYDFFPTDYTGYENLYAFKDHIVSDSINDEGGSAISALEVTSRSLFIPTQTPNELGQTPIQTSDELRKTIFSNVLASRIGVIVETYDVPGVTNHSKLAQLGYLEFNKRIANFNVFDMQTAYRPYIGVNRPIYHQIKERFGITKSVSYTWRVREDASLDLSLQYTRKRESDGKFRYVTGGERQPISYRSIFGGTNVKGQGVNHTPYEGGHKVTVPSDPKKTADKEANG